MNWENFEESKTELPDVVVAKAIEGFPNATNQLLELSLVQKSEMSRIADSTLQTRFQYSVLLKSNKLPDYSYRVFEFGYNVDLYPVKISIAKTIRDELVNSGESLTHVSSIDSEEKLGQVLELVFKSNRFKEIVGGLLKIVKNTELPF